MAFIPKKKRKRFERKKLVKFGKDQFYNSTAWRKTSKAIRETWARRHNGICPICLYNLVQMVDHVISRSIGGAEFDHDNTLPMCHSCHNVKRGFEANTNIPLIETKQSSQEYNKLVPVDKYDIIEVLNKNKYKPFEDDEL